MGVTLPCMALKSDCAATAAIANGAAAPTAPPILAANLPAAKSLEMVDTTSPKLAPSIVTALAASSAFDPNVLTANDAAFRAEDMPPEPDALPPKDSPLKTPPDSVTPVCPAMLAVMSNTHLRTVI